MRILTSARTAMASALITALGSGCKMKWYNGTMPTALGTPGGSLLATATSSGSIGTASAGAIDVDESAFSQTNSSHVNGTPTFVRLTTSADVAVIDIGIGSGADEWDFTGVIATGQNVTLTNLSLPMPCATA